jgi:hypothetical protein
MELEALKARLVPSGTIMMWSGPAEAIPEGWRLCDGTAGTPDLTDRFVRGAARTGEPHALTSGEADEHRHSFDPPSITTDTKEAGAHSHLMPRGWYNRGLGLDISFTANPFVPGGVEPKVGPSYSAVDTQAQDVTTSRLQTVEPHTHRIAIDAPEFVSHSASAGKPRWFALCFIVKR